MYRSLVGSEVLPEQLNLLCGEGSGKLLGVVFDAVDFSHGDDGESAVADGEAHHAGDDAAAGPGCRGAGALLDLGDHAVDPRHGGFTDADLAEGGEDVVPDGAPIGVERARRPLTSGDEFRELSSQISIACRMRCIAVSSLA
ncbi:MULTISPECIES: hypothetical protein [Kribbella]|uniref:hypothetical protein n=1 Tax=Kribbella sp. VKM Ac-2500 TaxID=2512214 RepID=UPI001050B08F|nr:MULTISPECIES: hypothetical protein [Kribbella]